MHWLFSSRSEQYLGPYANNQEMNPAWTDLIVTRIDMFVNQHHMHIFKDDLMNDWPQVISGMSFTK